MCWRLVKDNPPYENCDIFFSVPGFDTKLHIATVGFYSQGRFYSYENGGLTTFKQQDVKYWMPIPDFPDYPYKD